MTSVRLTYEELGERLGISAEAARQRAKRRQREGRWNIVLTNEDGRARVLLEEADLAEEAVRVPERTPERAADDRGDVHPDVPPDVRADIEEMRQSLAGLREQLERRLTESEIKAARLEVELATAKAETAAARAVAVADVEAAKRVAESEVAVKDELITELKAMLGEARRPWWRRLLGAAVLTALLAPGYAEAEQQRCTFMVGNVSVLDDLPK